MIEIRSSDADPQKRYRGLVSLEPDNTRQTNRFFSDLKAAKMREATNGNTRQNSRRPRGQGLSGSSGMPPECQLVFKNVNPLVDNIIFGDRAPRRQIIR